MARGGKRAGAGRPVGAVTKRTREVAERATEEGLTPLEFMLDVLRDDDQPMESRCWAAEKAAPYVHAKLASVEHKGGMSVEPGDELKALMARIAEHGSKIYER